MGNLLVQPWDLASSATRASFSIYLGAEFTACQTGDTYMGTVLWFCEKLERPDEC